jgi:predicted Zn finger-like uncharacterized protein
MIAACPHCGARYRIERERLSPQGARLRCARCEAVFRVSLPAEPVPAPDARESKAAQARPRSEPEASEVHRARPRSEPEVSEVDGAGRGFAQTSLADRLAAAPAPRPAPAPSEPRPLVLVADPDVEAGKAVASAVAGWGLEPLLVHDGVEAILTIQRTLPRLVVLEASLPKMFGFQVCELMKRNEQLRAIPVVLVGAIHHRDRYRRQAAETYGADAYVERPQLPDALVPILRQHGIAIGGAPAAPAPVHREPPPPVRREAPAPVRREAPARTEAPVRPEPVAPRVQAAAASAAEAALVADFARAERLARIIVSDVVLYSPEKFEAGVRAGNVLEAMSIEMEEGRAHFRERIPERVRERKDFLGEELLRVARLRGTQ